MRFVFGQTRFISHLAVVFPILGISVFSLALTCSQVVSTTEQMLDIPQKRSEIEFKAIANPKEALAAMVKMIQSAEKTIDLSTFIFRADDSGQIVLSELHKSISRGVRIRILVDSMGTISLNHPALRSLLTAAKEQESKFGPHQVQITTFNSIFKWSRYYNSVGNWFKRKMGLKVEEHGYEKSILSRLHDKILLVDAGTSKMLVMLGGRNVRNPYFDLANNGDSKISYKDFNILLRPLGDSDQSISATLTTYFEGLFYHQTNEILRTPKFQLFSQGKKRQRVLDQNQWLPEVLAKMNETQFLTTGFETGSAKFVHELQNITQSKRLFNFSSFNWKSPTNKNSIIRSLREAVRAAKKEVIIVTPYLMLSKKDMAQLRETLLLSPELRLHFITCSTQSTNMMAAQLIFETVVMPQLQKIQQDPQIGNRLQVLVYNPKIKVDKTIEGLLHAKLARIDGEYLITSSNFDLISRYSNSELGFWIQPKNPSEQLQGYLNSLYEHSLVWGSPEWQALPEYAPGSPWQGLKKYFGSFIEWFHIELFKISLSVKQFQSLV